MKKKTIILLMVFLTLLFICFEIGYQYGMSLPKTEIKYNNKIPKLP
jgi:hypothetical protein